MGGSERDNHLMKVLGCSDFMNVARSLIVVPIGRHVKGPLYERGSSSLKKREIGGKCADNYMI